MEFRNKIIYGDTLEVLRQMPSNAVDMCMCSPPYFGLRDYGIEGQIGLEAHPNMWIDKMVKISRELKRVLKKSGSYYLNVGDTYFGSGGAGGDYNEGGLKEGQPKWRQGKPKKTNWLQPKQLLGMPWRLAIALQEDGWILRNDIVWHKPNPMPSSVKDRLNTTWEHVFHFVQSRKYYYDLDAIRERHSQVDRRGNNRIVYQQRPLGVDGGGTFLGQNPLGKNPGDVVKLTKHEQAVGRVGDFSYTDPLHTKEYHPRGKNPGDFMSITTQPFPEAHFAVYPEELCERPIKSSCPRQICPKCGKPRERVVEYDYQSVQSNPDINSRYGDRAPFQTNVNTKGWTSCSCNVGFEPGIVLDPFVGSGTTCVVAKRMGLNYVGIDLNEEYCEMARQRLALVGKEQVMSFKQFRKAIKENVSLMEFV